MRVKYPRIAAFVALGAISFAAGACGEDEPVDPEAELLRFDEDPADSAGKLRTGAAAPIANCEDWKTAGPRVKRATVVNVRQSSVPLDTNTRSPTLPDDEAYKLFKNACEPEYANGFRLYKLYVRAAAFQSLQPHRLGDD